MIQKIKFIEPGNPSIEETWLAPHAGEEAFVVNYQYIIFHNDVIEFDADNYSNIYTVLQEWN